MSTKRSLENSQNRTVPESESELVDKSEAFLFARPLFIFRCFLRQCRIFFRRFEWRRSLCWGSGNVCWFWWTVSIPRAHPPVDGSVQNDWKYFTCSWLQKIQWKVDEHTCFLGKTYSLTQANLICLVPFGLDGFFKRLLVGFELASNDFDGLDFRGLLNGEPVDAVISSFRVGVAGVSDDSDPVSESFWSEFFGDSGSSVRPVVFWSLSWVGFSVDFSSRFAVWLLSCSSSDWLIEFECSDEFDFDWFT